MNNQSLATRTVRGVIWSGVGIAVHMVVTVLFVHAIALEDMGYFFWAQRLVVFVPLFSALGLNDALVKYKDAKEIHFSTAFWACFGFGWLLYFGLRWGGQMLGEVVALWATDVDASAFANVLIPLSLIVPAASVSGVFRARLARELNFRSIAFSEIVSNVVAAVVGLGLLAGGYGLESAIWNVIVREVVLLISLWVSAAWWPSFSFGWTSLREIIGFGLNVAGANIVNYINNNLDKVYFIPIYLGPIPTALYSFAYQYTMLPLSRGSQILTRVIFPAFSKVQDDDAILRRGYTLTITMIALLAWPALAGGFIYAPTILLLVKGEEMLTVLVPLRLLILAGMLKAVGTVMGSIFLAKGKADWSFRWMLANLAVFVPALYWGIQYGIDGVAAVLSVVSLLFLVITQGLVNRLIDLHIGVYLRALVRPLLVTVLVAVVLSVARSVMDMGLIEEVLFGGTVGALSYAVAIRLFAWDFVMRFWRDLRGAV